jgi:hypothetical protein
MVPDDIIIIRKLFTFIVLLNIVGLVVAIVDVWPYPRNYTDALILGNLLTAILVRNELFGRFLYLLVNKLFARVSVKLTLPYESQRILTIQWTPLWFRLACTSTLQHLGGIHSGCAVSGFGWLIYHMVLIFEHHKDNPNAILIIGVVTSIVLAICAASALPWIRNRHHKYDSGFQTWNVRNKPYLQRVRASPPIPRVAWAYI